jgi:hypothetical protein
MAITSSPNLTPRVLKRWLIAISSKTVASVTVSRTYSSEYCRAPAPCSKTSVAWSFNLAASSVLELRYSAINCGPAKCWVAAVAALRNKPEAQKAPPDRLPLRRGLIVGSRGSFHRDWLLLPISDPLQVMPSRSLASGGDPDFGVHPLATDGGICRTSFAGNSTSRVSVANQSYLLGLAT